jgi:hypothetical protein
VVLAEYLEVSQMTPAQAQVRREMFSAASELAYLSGWMAFDDAEH